MPRKLRRQIVREFHKLAALRTKRWGEDRRYVMDFDLVLSADSCQLNVASHNLDPTRLP